MSVKEAVGVDISSGIVKQYNAGDEKLGLPIDKKHAVCVDLQGTDQKLGVRKFGASSNRS